MHSFSSGTARANRNGRGGADAPQHTDSFAPVETIAGNPSTGLLLLCDHASSGLPARYGTLGLARAQLERHIGYDIGARALTHALAQRLGAPAVLSTFSRLLIDPNRGEDDPTLVMRISDGAMIPANAYIDADERQRRVERYYRPYHDTVEATIERMMASGTVPAVFSIHSFTPVWRGWPRPWHAGVLWDSDPRMSVPLIEALRRDAALVVGDNEPYTGGLKNDTMYKHCTTRGLAHALIEVRQDLLDDEAGVVAWADRLAPILQDLMATSGIHEIRRYGSKADLPPGGAVRSRS